MKNVEIAFQTMPEGEKPPSCYQYVNGHMVFDIKMEDIYMRKACLVAGGLLTHTPDFVTYSSVVTRKSVYIALIIALLHDDLEDKAADVLNAYVMTPNNEFGDNADKSARALHSLKSAGASFRAHLVQNMCELGYKSCDSDPEPWMKPEFRPEDKLEYHLYILCYVDDILCIHHEPDDISVVIMLKSPITQNVPNMKKDKNDVDQKKEMIIKKQALMVCVNIVVRKETKLKNK